MKRHAIKESNLLDASLVTPSFLGVLEGLLNCSIGSNPTDVRVCVDCEKLELKITDNGEGLSRDLLFALGQSSASAEGAPRRLAYLEAGMNMLAALAVTSQLEVVSRRRGEFLTWRASYTSDTLEIGLATQQQGNHGTMFCVRSFLSRLPIRQQQQKQTRYRTR